MQVSLGILYPCDSLTVSLTLCLCDANRVGDTQSFQYPSLLNGSANWFTPESLSLRILHKVACRTALGGAGVPQETSNAGKKHLHDLPSQGIISSKNRFQMCLNQLSALELMSQPVCRLGHGVTCETLESWQLKIAKMNLDANCICLSGCRTI